MHQLLGKLRNQIPTAPPPALVAGYYEYADSWNDRALYVRVQYAPLQSLRVEIYIDHSKPEPDVGVKLSLGERAARFMSLISAGPPGWPCHGEGVGTLLGNCTVAFLQAIYPSEALLSGWAPATDFPSGEETDSVRDRGRRFWARFGVRLDEYNMFDVKIGDLALVDNGKSCLEYFPGMLPVTAFRHAGTSVRDFRLAIPAEVEDFLWLSDIRSLRTDTPD